MSTAPKLGLNTIRIVWAALLVSTVVHVAVLFFLDATQWSADTAPDPDPMPMIIAGIGIVEAPVVFVLRKVFLGSLALTTPDATGTRDIAKPADLDFVLAPVIRRYTTGTIIGCALAESVVLFGFVAAYLAQDPFMALPNWALGAGLIAIQFPRWEGVAHLLQPAERAALYARHNPGHRA